MPWWSLTSVPTLPTDGFCSSGRYPKIRKSSSPVTAGIPEPGGWLCWVFTLLLLLLLFWFSNGLTFNQQPMYRVTRVESIQTVSGWLLECLSSAPSWVQIYTNGQFSSPGSDYTAIPDCTAGSQSCFTSLHSNNHHSNCLPFAFDVGILYMPPRGELLSPAPIDGPSAFSHSIG